MVFTCIKRYIPLKRSQRSITDKDLNLGSSSKSLKRWRYTNLLADATLPPTGDCSEVSQYSNSLHWEADTLSAGLVIHSLLWNPWSTAMCTSFYAVQSKSFIVGEHIQRRCKYFGFCPIKYINGRKFQPIVRTDINNN